MPYEVFGSLTVIRDEGRYRVCKCECGVEKRIRIDHLISGATVSCGCVGRRKSAAAKTTHGMSNTRVFKIWLGMIDRCRNDRQGNYGARGIAVCAKWEKSFEAFYADMGDPPSAQHSLDRIDVNGDYEPGNCRWATRNEQARNTTRNTVLTKAGQSMTIAEWSEKTGIKDSTICERIYSLGWSVERALTEPAKTPRNDKPWLAAGVSRSTWYRQRVAR